MLRRTEADCRDLAGPGSRVRLCKGAYDEPASVAYQGRRARSTRRTSGASRSSWPGRACRWWRRTTRGWSRSPGYLAQRNGRSVDDYELQMLYGVRPNAQTTLAAEGERVRVYLPYGTEWFGYFMRRLAERPANLAFFARSLLTRG